MGNNSIDNILPILRGLTLFADLTEAQLEKVAGMCEKRPFSTSAAPEICFIKEGTITGGLYIVASGALEIVSGYQLIRMGNADSLEEHQYEKGYLLPAGSYFRDSWLFQPTRHTADLRAQSDGVLLVVPSKKFQALLKGEPKLGERLRLSPAGHLKRPLSFKEKADTLRQMPIFSQLVADNADDGGKGYKSLKALAAITEQYAFYQNTFLVHQRDVVDTFYVLLEGTLIMSRQNEYGETTFGQTYVGPVTFDDTWLFTTKAHEFDIKAHTDGRLLAIPIGKFLETLDKNPGMGKRLSLSSKAREEFLGSKYAQAESRQKSLKLLPGESIKDERKRSRWLLAFQLFFPVLGLLFVPFLVFMLLSIAVIPNVRLWFSEFLAVWSNLGLGQALVNLSLRDATFFITQSAAAWVLFVVAFIIALVYIAFIVFRWFDWSNDYLLVTNKRVIRHEYDLRTFSGRGQNTPIEQVQSMDVQIPNIWSSLLGLGRIDIYSASGSSTVAFDYIPNPAGFQKSVDAAKAEIGKLSKGAKQIELRHSLEAHFEIPQSLGKMEQEAAPADDISPLAALWKKINGRIQTLLLPIHPRIEDKKSGTITYHKHIITLFGDLVWPLAFLLGVVIAWVALKLAGSTPNAPLFWILGILALSWTLWQAEDWRNDTFQVTKEFIIDVDRKPLGFGESRKTARLDKIQEVRAVRPNIWATIFRYGDVNVETAGAQSNIVFENVADPDRVKEDIFKQRDKYNKEAEKKKLESQRREYTMLLDVYRQEREMGRIPRRMSDI